jgi:hypothetical protein
MKLALRIYGLLTLATAMVAAHLVSRIFFQDSPFEGAHGLVVLWGETAAVGVGLAMMRFIEGAREGAKERADNRGELIGAGLASYDISRT